MLNLSPPSESGTANSFSQACKRWYGKITDSWVTIVVLTLLMPTTAYLKHRESSANQTARIQAREEQELQEEKLQEETENRWRIIRFYDMTIYKPGDFPRKGYYQEDGTHWTPEIGGSCYDEGGDFLVPSLDQDPDWLRRVGLIQPPQP